MPASRVSRMVSFGGEGRWREYHMRPNSHGAQFSQNGTFEIAGTVFTDQ